jgi:tetratricopeptide (TPR) repeat protein
MIRYSARTLQVVQSPLSKIIDINTYLRPRAVINVTVTAVNLNAQTPRPSDRESGNSEAQRHFQSAQNHQGQNRLLEAMVEYREVLRIEPDNEQASIALAMLLSQMGRKQQAEAVCREQMQQFPTLIRLHLTLASFLIPEQRYQEADHEIDSFFSAAGKVPEIAHERVYARYLQGIILMGQSRAEEGIRRLLDVVKMDPRFVEAHMELADYYSQSSQTYEKAVDHLTSVLTLKANLSIAQLAAAHGTLGKVFVQLDRYESAIENLQKAINLDPTLSSAYFDLAKVYRKLGKLAKARDVLTHFEALHAEVESQMERRKRALALYQEGEQRGSEGRFDEALKAFQECQQLAPERSQFDSIFPPDRAYYGLAFVNFTLGHFAIARQNIEKAVDLYPFDPRYYEAYAMTLDRLHDYETAVVMIKKALQLSPAVHGYYNLLGNIFSEGICLPA